MEQDGGQDARPLGADAVAGAESDLGRGRARGRPERRWPPAGFEEAVEQRAPVSRRASARSPDAPCGGSRRARKPAAAAREWPGRRPPAAGRTAPPRAGGRLQHRRKAGRPGGAPACPGPRRTAARRSAGCGPARAAARRSRPPSPPPGPRPRRRRSTGSGAGDRRHSSFKLLFGQCGPERRDRAAEPGLVQRDHVHIAFDDHQRRALPDASRARSTPYRLRRFENSARLRAVEVFRLAVPERPPAEADHPAAPVPDREHHPIEEEIEAGARSRPAASAPPRPAASGVDALPRRIRPQRPPPLAGPAEAEAFGSSRPSARGPADTRGPACPPAGTAVAKARAAAASSTPCRSCRRRSASAAAAWASAPPARFSRRVAPPPP